MKQVDIEFDTKKEAPTPVVPVAIPSHDIVPHIFTVSELNSMIKDVVEVGFRDIWLNGEISGLKATQGRHLYFDLKDEKSKVRAMIFGATPKRFPFELKDGLEVVCHGKLSLYVPWGQYSLIVDQIEPKGVGALQLAFEQLKERLKNEGLFDDKHKKPIPKFPRKIGVVTSPTGAVIMDMLNILKRRFSNIELLLAPVKVQGEGAALEIAEGIRALNRFSDIDLMIVGRGGGSLEDLWAFNEEVVARAIFESRIPIISAVGHEVDFTIADFVADLRAPTPSAAAEIAVPVKSELVATLKDMQRRLDVGLNSNHRRFFESLKNLRARLKSPDRILVDLSLKIDDFFKRLQYLVGIKVELKEKGFRHLVSELKHLSPLGILSKGYSVVKSTSGEILKSIESVEVGDNVSIKLYKGELEAKVVNKH